MSQQADGVLAIRPVGSDWPPGRYGVWMRSGANVQSVAFCVH